MKPDVERLQRSIPFGEVVLPFQSYLDFVSLSPDDLKGKKILDLGSGLHRTFAKNVNLIDGARVTSLEPRVAFETADSTELAPVVAGMADEMPFDDNTFDLVISFTAIPMWLETPEEIQAVFREIDRVLKPGGEARLYPPFHNIFWEDFRAGKTILPPGLDNNSQGSKTSHITLIGLQNLGIDNLDLVRRETVGGREMVSQPEYLRYRKPNEFTSDIEVKPGEGIKDLIPLNPQRQPEVIQVENSDQGVRFFSSFRGADLSGVSVLRLPTHDVVALTTRDRRAILAIAERDGFIATEIRDSSNLDRNANLAFRDDISHRRLNFAASMIKGENVIYNDSSLVHGDTLSVDSEADFVRFSFDEGSEIEEVRPSWYTEDRLTVRLTDGRYVVIRTDRMALTGAISINPSGVDYLNMSGDVTGLLSDLSKSQPLPAKALS